MPLGLSLCSILPAPNSNLYMFPALLPPPPPFPLLAGWQRVAEAGRSIMSPPRPASKVA